MDKDFLKVVGAIAMILLVIFLIAVGPLLTIWALNTVFPALAIGYTWKTWVAVLLLCLTLHPVGKNAKK